jgi:hypothetical protein
VRRHRAGQINPILSFLVPEDFAGSPDDRRTGPGIDDVSQ